MRRLAGLVMVVLFAGCGGSEDFSLGQWRNQDGSRLPESTVYSKHGYEHCGTEDVWVLAIGRDRREVYESAGQLFLRDPGGVTRAHLGPNRPAMENFAEVAELPAEALETGYRNGDVELWLDPGGLAAYLVFEDRIERWPKTWFDLECD